MPLVPVDPALVEEATARGPEPSTARHAELSRRPPERTASTTRMMLRS